MGPGAGARRFGVFTFDRTAHSMFISPAFAQAAGPAVDPLGGLLIPMLLMLVIFYFFLIRPQSQRAKEHARG